jgi:hypothetical protein
VSRRVGVPLVPLGGRFHPSIPSDELLVVLRGSKTGVNRPPVSPVSAGQSVLTPSVSGNPGPHTPSSGNAVPAPKPAGRALSSASHALPPIATVYAPVFRPRE